MRIAFVYDRVNKFGGAERVLLALHEIWPEAPLYTAFYNKEKAAWADVFEVKPTFLNLLPFVSDFHEIFPLLTPYAFESLKLEDYDVVLSITSSDAKAVITHPDTLHICYILTPTRYLWSGFNDYLDNPGFGFLNPMVKVLMKLFAPSLRSWDYTSSKRPDTYISISETVARRVKSYYRVDSTVIYPPVDTELFHPGEASDKSSGDYFLIVSRLVPYKKIDYAISTFNDLGWKLKIIGKGIDEKRLKRLAKNNIEFITGSLTDEKVCWYYQNCKALVNPGEEDFGISAVEAQSCGKPVVGISSGGTSEIVIEGETGELYQNPDKKSLISALKKIKRKKYSASDCRFNAIRFSKRNFQKIMKQTVENYWQNWKKNH